MKRKEAASQCLHSFISHVRQSCVKTVILLLFLFIYVYLEHNKDVLSDNYAEDFDAVCTVHHLTVCVWINKMHRILVTTLYFPLDALHVSDCVSPSSVTTFWSCISQLVQAGTIQPHNSHTYGTAIYQMRCTAYKVAPDDGLIQSETCRASYWK